MDIKLKGEMDGIATAERIRKRFDLPVVFLTAKAMAVEVQRLKDLGAKGVVLKPFNPMTLAAEVTAILNQ